MLSILSIIKDINRSPFGLYKSQNLTSAQDVLGQTKVKVLRHLVDIKHFEHFYQGEQTHGDMQAGELQDVWQWRTGEGDSANMRDQLSTN
eukprot:scaffold317993_cov21-Tisochrysis_lutea.AAC.1